MAGSRRRRRQQRQRQKERQQAAAAAAAAAAAPARPFQFHHLPAELLAEIHHRLAFLRRLAFASVCGASGHHLKPETPWLILPAENEDRARVLSLSDGESASVRTSDVAMRGHVAIGSSGGWLVTADDRGALRMANPATGAHADLPAITTVPFIEPRFGGHWFNINGDPFLQARFGGPPPPPTAGRRDDFMRCPYSLTAAQMRQLFYRKVVLSASPRPNSYAAMLIMERCIGAPAFATSEDADPSWRMARSRDAVEDAIHHDGRFLSITYTGHVEAWQRDADTGEFSSEAVAPRLDYEDKHLRRKYIAASTDGSLMAVLKHARDDDVRDAYHSRGARSKRVFFKVQVLDRAKGRWEEAADIGDAALFVGANGSLCLSTREHQGTRPGCVYFTDDEVGEACLSKAKANCRQRSYSYGEVDDTELRDVGVYNLKAGRLETIRALGEHQIWPPPAWFTPSFL